jgi:hypothetical protein
MSHFPLYDNLLDDIDDTDLTVSQKNKFIRNVKKIDKNGHELIYALIRMYQLENNEENISFMIPFKGTYVDNNICFDLDILPLKLKQMLFKFINIHISKMKEEKQLKKLR